MARDGHLCRRRQGEISPVPLSPTPTRPNPRSEASSASSTICRHCPSLAKPRMVLAEMKRITQTIT
ncbi:hypothetical protein SO802_033330 [Lithocarpus litseifolius]|uniref:Uncharacterized protein n=1 Tax=Lithocarpus litseifolius TaxID=425828 RepID=A0AAW2BI91_9ROSI